MKLRTVALCCIGLMLSIPFLDWRHTLPIPSFYAQWDAFSLSFGALLLLLLPSSWRDQKLPRVMLLPAALVMIILLQLLLGLITYPDQALTYSLYLIWAMMMMLLGRRLVEALSLPYVVTMLACFVLAGGELSALTALIQYYDWHSLFDDVVFRTGLPIRYGNIAQLNHFASYTALALASLGLLHARRSLTWWQTLLLALPLLFVLTLSASRSSWLYLGAFASMTFIWRSHDQSLHRLMKYALLLLPAFLLMHGVVHLPMFEVSVPVLTPLEKMSDVSGYMHRLYLWREAWLVFTGQPWLGIGFGGLAWQHFVLAPELGLGVTNQLGNHAHNLLMQLAAETGLAGLLILLTALTLWLKAQHSQSLTLYRSWCFMLLLILAIHSMLEYPLWYAFFLGIAALLLGMLDEGHVHFSVQHNGPLLMVLFLLGFGLILCQHYSAYIKLESLYTHSANTSSEEDERRVNKALDLIAQASLLSRDGEMYALTSGTFGISNAEKQLLFSERLMHAMPSKILVYRVAVLMAVMGRKKDAEAQMRRAIRIYPDHYDTVVSHALPWLVLQAPKQLKPLSDFAHLAYKDRQRLIGNN